MSNLKRRMILTSAVSVCALMIATTLPASASAAPTQYFTGVQTSVNGPQTVVAAGPISATGTDTQLGNHRDTFVFPDGTITVRHEQNTERQTFDVRTCVGTFTETGNYVIAKGTGAYAYVTGSGHYVANGTVQGCDRNSPPSAFSVVIQAHGPIALG